MGEAVLSVCGFYGCNIIKNYRGYRIIIEFHRVIFVHHYAPDNNFNLICYSGGDGITIKQHDIGGGGDIRSRTNNHRGVSGMLQAVESQLGLHCRKWGRKFCILHQIHCFINLVLFS